MLLSLYLGLFVADATISLADATWTALSGFHFLPVFGGLLSFLGWLMAGLIYGLMALTPMIPKRIFLPLTLFNPAAMLAAIPLAIFFYDRLQLIGWAVSACQAILGLFVFCRVAGGFKFRWPVFAVDQFNPRAFSWANLAGFLAITLCVLLPAGLLYLAFNAALAVDHFSEGFVSLRPGGISVQVRKYVRDDGKVIELFPMAHVADAGFYRQVSQTFPTNSLILMEGVSDDQNLLTNKITYRRMARSLGLAEQREEFNPGRGKQVRADVDIGEFSAETIGFLNLVMLVHAWGVNPDVLIQLARYSPPPHFEERLFADLLARRNRHLLGEIQARLPETDNLMIPWGAAHMPGIAREIQRTGFRLVETREYQVIRFGGFDPSKKVAGP